MASIARLFGLSPTTFRRGLYIIEHADAGTKQKLRNGELEINTVYQKLTREAEAKGFRELEKLMKEHPELFVE